MSKVAKSSDGRLLWYCQGCGELHFIDSRWSYNGIEDSPTFTPSVLVRGTRMTEKGEADYEEWCKSGYPERNGEPFENAPSVCHTFVTNGKIQYLNDCTHKLAGQTVDMFDEEDWFKDGQ